MTMFVAATGLAAISLMLFVLKKRRKTEGAKLASSQDHYHRLNIEKGHPAAWEDGMRTHGGKNSYEWWYADAEFEDGTTIVTIFFSKYHFDVKGPACPTATLTITYPDGREIKDEICAGYNTPLVASKDRCDVVIGKAYLKYEEGVYRLRYANQDIEYEATMTSILPMWRPETGHWYFGDEEKHYFSWFVAQPASTVEGSLKVGGTVLPLKGNGYHDHNWGNLGMSKIMNHWYWGRAKIGEYTVIACDIVSEKRYGFLRLPVMMIAKGSQILADDQSRTIIERLDTHQHPITGKFMDDHLTFIQPSDNGTLYKFEYIREKDILVVNLLNRLPKNKQLLAKILGANPTYTRITGKARLTVTHADGQCLRYEDEGLWEQMSFGKNKTATINLQPLERTCEINAATKASIIL